MSQKGICTMCKQLVSMEYPHSCYDVDAAERLRVAERAVIDAAVAWAATETESRAEERALGELFDAVKEMQEVD